MVHIENKPYKALIISYYISNTSDIFNFRFTFLSTAFDFGPPNVRQPINLFTLS